MSSFRDLDDFDGLDAVKCLACGRLEPWPAEGPEPLFAARWRMTADICPTWLCPDHEGDARFSEVRVEPAYWPPSQVGPNAVRPA